MCCELLQPYPLSRQTCEFPLRYWFGSDYRGSGGWTSSQESAKRERQIGGELQLLFSSNSGTWKKYASFNVAEATPGLGVCS